MGCMVEKAYDGTELEVHRFDSKLAAIHYLEVARGYQFDRHEPWGFTSGIDFYGIPTTGKRASLRQKGGYWEITFWERRGA